jgi:hypothetical protein
MPVRQIRFGNRRPLRLVASTRHNKRGAQRLRPAWAFANPSLCTTANVLDLSGRNCADPSGTSPTEL